MKDNIPCGLHCIKANGISVKFGTEEILQDINIHIHCGELTVIIGKNGAGKSTLLKSLLGEIKHKGTIEFVDKKDNSTPNLKIGYVPQAVNIEKYMPTTVYDLFASLISNKPIWIKKDKKLEQIIKWKLSVFNVEHLIDKGVGELSGGELQRVLLAIATMPIPNLLILDEPVSGIDKNGTLLFYDMVNKLKRENDMAIILVSHDLELVKKYADRVILLDKKIVKQGTALEVFESREFKEIFA